MVEGGERIGERAMTAHAILLQDAAAGTANLDGLAKSLRREELAVPIAIFGFCIVFADKILRQVAVDAHSHRVVARLLPSVILGLHDMAVHAGLGIGTQIREAFGIAKRVRAEAP